MFAKVKRHRTAPHREPPMWGARQGLQHVGGCTLAIAINLRFKGSLLQM